MNQNATSALSSTNARSTGARCANFISGKRPETTLPRHLSLGSLERSLGPVPLGGRAAREERPCRRERSNEATTSVQAVKSTGAYAGALPSLARPSLGRLMWRRRFDRRVRANAGTASLRARCCVYPRRGSARPPRALARLALILPRSEFASRKIAPLEIAARTFTGPKSSEPK